MKELKEAIAQKPLEVISAVAMFAVVFAAFYLVSAIF